MRPLLVIAERWRTGDLAAVSVAVTIAVGVNDGGRREILGLAVGCSEVETFWTDFLRSLARGAARS